MSNRHLPAGQHLQAASGGIPGADMGHGGGKGGPRRRQPQYMPHYHHQPPHQQQQQQQQHMAPIYYNNMPYPPQQYYAMSPQYSSGGGMPSPGGYMAYQAYARSPPVQQYVPMAGISVNPSYPRHSQQSPNLATPYQPPPAPIAGPPQTPSSTRSTQMVYPPTPPTPHTLEPLPSQTPPPIAASPVVIQGPRFQPPLPWLSRPEEGFPKRSRRSKTKRKHLPADGETVSFPIEQLVEQQDAAAERAAAERAAAEQAAAEQAAAATKADFVGERADANGTLGTGMTARAEEEKSLEALHSPRVNHTKATIVGDTATVPQAVQAAEATANGHHYVKDDSNRDVASAENAAAAVPETESAASASAIVAPVKATPTSWAKLFSPPSTQASSQSAGGGTAGKAGEAARTATGGNPEAQASLANKSVLADTIQSFRVSSTTKASLIEPRGLINTGNMCYMNSILQTLMYCGPFYDFLDRLSKTAAHRFKSPTPLVDILVVFMQEFKVLALGNTSDQLRDSVRSEVFEKYGEPFTPEFVYEAIGQLSRFASMEHGHQQDAEEFLGFLLQTLDDECTHLMNNPAGQQQQQQSQGKTLPSASGADQTGDWLEVGRKQKAAVTRSSGTNSLTPITKIFGGLLRSELRVPGLKDSITTEPYQPLQLDIGSPDIRNVVDALRGLTRPERLQGDFNSPRGKDVMATKQVFIESLPPVLILHLKRFQFDAEGRGTIKIWKKVGYPLELDIPREALSRQRRQILGEGSMPRYRLISVVYHHGKNASGGHYTVDVRRQDGFEWIRIDDTVIRRIRSEDVAEAGSEEDTKEGGREQSPTSGASGNRFGAINDEDNGDEEGWKQVTASASGSKRWNNVANGATRPSSRDTHAKENIKDNKVAYLLFYQRM